MGTYSDESPDASLSEKVANAVKKTVQGVSDLTAPRSVTQAPYRRKQQEALANGQHSADTLARMRGAQSSDSDNSYE